MTPILILAAGTSSRMRGRDKLLEEVEGAPVLRVLATRAASLGEPVFVALPALDHPRARALTGLDVTLLSIPAAPEGMGVTLRDAVAALPDAPRFMVLLGDMPDIGADHMKRVLDAALTHPDQLIWRGSTEDGKPGHPMLFDKNLRPQFATLSGDDGGRALVAPYRDRTQLVPLPGQIARGDLDTPEDWDDWRMRSAP
ncbi:MAG: nucleotidyltransferase family protein [Flavimaricola sp.]|nr:nucleotidyltransferase family protein [Flavimaricola sp.]